MIGIFTVVNGPIPVMSIADRSVNHSKWGLLAGMIIKLPGPYTFAGAVVSAFSLTTIFSVPEITVIFRSPGCVCRLDRYPGGKMARSTNNPGNSRRLTRKIFFLPFDKSVSFDSGMIISAVAGTGCTSSAGDDCFCLQPHTRNPASSIICRNRLFITEILKRLIKELSITLTIKTPERYKYGISKILTSIIRGRYSGFFLFSRNILSL